MDLGQTFRDALREARESAPAQSTAQWLNDLNSFTHEADNEAEKRFPGQARDSSQSLTCIHCPQEQDLGVPFMEFSKRKRPFSSGPG